MQLGDLQQFANGEKKQTSGTGTGVSKNSGTPKWMVYNVKMDDLGVPLFLETPTWGIPGRTGTLLITMMMVSPQDRLWDPFQMAEIHGL